MSSSRREDQSPRHPRNRGKSPRPPTHAEYIGQCNAILHLQWLRTFLAETNLYQSPETHVTAVNQSAIALSQEPEFHKRSKHFNDGFHYQRSVLGIGESKFKILARPQMLVVSSSWSFLTFPLLIVLRATESSHR
jgi:hypothetical protein